VRPLRVVMQAFGPYAGEQVLDFADLRGAPFFLITGPTGSGKTTVLDAMAFALYGVTSGGPESEGGRSGASMRSDHADPQLLTRVAFDFALGADLYRIEREPEQQRPKLRGDGTTTHGQAATLWRLRHDDGPDGRATRVHDAPLATGWTRVSTEAESMLGFRSEQFRQVVMLPQGRFQKLLEADSKEREHILRALFDTDHYALLEQTLKDQAVALRRAAEKLGERRDEVLRQAEATSADNLDERRARQALEAAEADEIAQQAEAARDAAQARLIAGSEAAARLTELAEAHRGLEALTECAAQVDEVRRERDAAASAATIADVAQAATAARAQSEARTTASQEAAAEHERLAAADTEAAAALAAHEARTGEREAAAAEALRLKSLVGATDALAGARAAEQSADAEATKAKAAGEAADSRWATAHERLTAAETSWFAGQAGLLAAGLQDAAPCPVCGALDHPSPAVLAADVPAQTELEQLRRTVAELLETREAARRRLAQATAALAAAAACTQEREHAAAPEFADPATLAAAIAAAERQADALTRAQRAAADAAHAAHIAAATAAERRQNTAAEALRAQQELGEACARFASRLAQAGFDDEAAWAAACRPPAHTQRLHALVDTHDQDCIKAAERLRLAQAAAQGIEPPDLPALEQAAAAATAAARGARDAAAGLAAAAAMAGRHLERLAELAAQERSLGASYAVLGRLADVATGGNTRHLSFRRYVLGAFLDDVLVAASQRLHLMTKGRYRLERTERRAGGKAAAGLNLEVYDAWTGVARPVATLSGGETFMAALSLALGLAEVVQAHAGGIRLETVFVDEGFGSLDEESLDLALAALMSLNEGGRLVGIISHVAELRERIDARLEVSAGKTGSTARFVAQ
jgi:DNA repair protein SbcC/Rad50